VLQAVCADALVGLELVFARNITLLPLHMS